MSYFKYIKQNGDITCAHDDALKAEKTMRFCVGCMCKEGRGFRHTGGIYPHLEVQAATAAATVAVAVFG